MRAFLLLGMLVLTAAVAGCGGDDEPTVASRTATESASTGTVEPTTTEAPTTTAEPEAEAPRTTERESTPTTDEAQPDPAPGGGGDGSADGGSGDTGSAGGGGGGDTGSEGGGSSGDQQAVQDAALTFLRGLAGGDGEGACGVLTDQVRQQVEKTLGQAPGFKGKACAGLIDTISRNYPDQMRQSLGDIKVLRVTVNGETAAVQYQAGSLPKAQVPLVRVGGDWKVGALAAPGQTG